MDTMTYQERRGQLEAYFDRTASEAWARLTSDAPVNRIRATVREGRDQMRALLRGWLPDDLRDVQILDAGCGTGTFALELARAGARVTAVDLSPTLVALARERAEAVGASNVDFRVGDMLADDLHSFDFVVAMDSLIHYEEKDMVRMVAALAERARQQLVFTFAPRTPPLAAMHFVGRFFPRGNKSPAIEPIAERRLTQCLAEEPRLLSWRSGRTQRVSRGFYTSQAMEVIRS